MPTKNLKINAKTMKITHELKPVSYGKFQEPREEKKEDPSLLDIYKTIIACQIIALTCVGMVIKWFG